MVSKMSESVSCPKCGSHLRKGSTFCLKCGTKLTGTEASVMKAEVTEAEIVIEDITEGDVTLPEIEEWGKVPDDTDDLMRETMEALEDSKELLDSNTTEKPVELPPEEDLSWETDLETDEEAEDVELAPSIIEDEPEGIHIEKPPIAEEPKLTSRDLSWESPEAYRSEIKEGMPFKEVAPPRVIDADVIEVSNDEVVEHLFTESPDDDTREAVTHLFPRGRGETTTDFIEIAVGKPKKIGTEISPILLEAPTCPGCGATIGSDSFEYPPYVYEAMGKARLEEGARLMANNEHENAIEQFEIAKKLFEHGELSKLVEEAIKQVDAGYDGMAEHHYIQAENHLREGQFDWAIVQFKKARELYMFSTDERKRARCSQRTRYAYEEWGKCFENDGDNLAKSGQTRDALAKYSESAEKYREAEVPKRLRGLEKKIRNA
ncbi:MAG: zinc-ribbon domain-containing protein [Candidatus Thorarchaeota archaeon]|nr:zinc-ribbon domain-containing protein [Candidatus Thorarchaeota archaeon]